jgi:hypothetical protein
VVDAQGLPLAQSLTAANVNDCKEALPLLDDIKPVKSPHGPSRKRPEKVHADNAYNHPFQPPRPHRAGNEPPGLHATDFHRALLRAL